MYSRNHCGGSLEITNEDGRISGTEGEDQEKKNNAECDRLASHHELDATQQSWLLGKGSNTKSKNKYVDLGCVICSRKVLRWTVVAVVVAVVVIVLPVVIAKFLPKHKQRASPPDDYTLALHKALLFFNAQKSGKLPKNNGINWRGDSGLQDGSMLTDVKGGLIGGYYDAGDNVKFNFPMSFAMTMLSWSVIEYGHKYKDIEEYQHARGLIKWGTDYLLLTFNSSSAKISKIYSQVGGSQNGSTTPDDHTCWTRPEDMDYPRPVQTSYSGPDLAGEMAAAMAAASIVFRDNKSYSKKLVNGAATVFSFARDFGKRSRYSQGNPNIEPFYNSTGYYDEYMWGAAWLFYATGNYTYLSLATNPGLSKNSKAFYMIPDLSVVSWDNKLPAAMLLLTRLRIFLSPGYPYEDMLKSYHNVTSLNMCSYLRQYNVFNWTKGGLIQLNHKRGQTLQYVANTAFLASLYADYLTATGVPGWNCGPTFIPSDVLRGFATSQMDYILGKNPANMSYVVGHGTKFPRYVHHRGASIPNKNIKYSCKGGWQWYNTPKPNPNTITGAMVGGPIGSDQFHDTRLNYSYTEPTIAGNAGLVAALVSLTVTSTRSNGIDKNKMFSAVPPMYPPSPPPPAPWKP